MNKFLFSAAVIAVFGLISCSEQAATDEGGSSENSSEATASAITADNVEALTNIEFAEEAFDFGEITQGEKVEHTFMFKNTGENDLVIVSAKGSCGCTIPKWPKEPIAPGATAKITVKYDTKRPGAINKSVTITSNAVNEPTKTVRIKGNIKAKPTSTAPIQSGGPVNN